MRTTLRLLFLLIVAPVVVGGTLYLLETKGFFNLDHITIVVSGNADHPRFMRPLLEETDREFEKLRGKSLWRIDLDETARSLTAVPWIRKMQIRRHWPDRIEVRIEAKEARFLFIGKKGQLFPVLDDGTFMDSVAMENLPDVILLRGQDFVQNKKLLDRALRVLEEIPREGSFSRRSISEIRYDSKDGFWATMMKDGIGVKLGEDQIVLKSDRVSQVLEYLQAHSFDARVIDANLTKKVLVRLRKGP